MKTKKCTKCCIEQPLCNFYKDKGRLRSDCKKCKKGAARKYCNRVKNTPEGYLISKYKGMRQRVRGTRGGIARAKDLAYYKHLPICSRDHFMKWALSDKEFRRLFKQWELSGYEYRLTPTIDRINSNKGYTLDNMQFLTLVENSRKAGFKTQGVDYEATAK